MTKHRSVAFAAAAALACGALGAGPSHAQGRNPAQGPPVSAADVVLYIDRAPCAGAAPVAEIVVQQESMTLAEAMRALRLEAAHRGADGVADIGIAAGTEGRFRVSGTAIRCAASGAPAPQAPSGAAPQPRPRAMPQPRSAVEPPPAAVDKRVMDFLGPEIVAVVRAADRVESVHLGGRGADGRTVQDFAVLGAGRDLSPDRIGVLRRLILDPASYVFDSSKRCPFIADAGFVLHSGDAVATVALATRCNLWSFAPGSGGRPAIEDFDPAADALKALLAEALGQK